MSLAGNIGVGAGLAASFDAIEKISHVQVRGITGDFRAAPDEKAVREHAKAGGFPANAVFRVARMIDPTTSE